VAAVEVAESTVNPALINELLEIGLMEAATGRHRQARRVVSIKFSSKDITTPLSSRSLLLPQPPLLSRILSSRSPRRAETENESGAET
jgi:hypothetical protein